MGPPPSPPPAGEMYNEGSKLKEMKVKQDVLLPDEVLFAIEIGREQRIMGNVLSHEESNLAIEKWLSKQDFLDIQNFNL